MTTETRSWQDCLVDTILEEIALGMNVRIVLPGASGPMQVEDARVEAALVLLSDHAGTRYYLGSMAGVVLLAAPLEGKGTGTWRQHSWTPTMSLDDKAPDIRSRRPTFDAPQGDTSDVEGLTDRELLTAYQKTDGDPESHEVNRMVREIERRGLDV